MPRYFFHIEGSPAGRDETGTDLPDLAAARSAALAILFDMSRGKAQALWDDGGWRVTVADEAGLTLFSLELAPTDAPVLGGGG